ncbi:MAG: polysaccharide biosynthesis tyrosine autokinase, partial [Longimicrobiales bacterium]
QVEISGNLYTTLEERHEEARLAAASSIPDVRILSDAAIPHQPVQNDKPMIVLLAFAGALGLGIVGAVLRDRLDPRLRYPDQVTSEFGLPILGALPQAGKGTNPDSEIAAQLVESFRSLRLNMIHAHGAGPVVVTVTSPGSGDGKSFVSMNLAVAFGDLGLRTLLVDGDIRRGVVQKLIGGEPGLGLTNHLNDDVPLESIISRTDYKKLDLIPAGSRLTRGPELLGSPRMREMMLELRRRYDVILVDSPPLAAGADPYQLGTLTGAMLIVLRTGETDRPLAHAKLELLDRLPIRILGAALNSVPNAGVYRYYSYLSEYALTLPEQTDGALPAGVG